MRRASRKLFKARNFSTRAGTLIGLSCTFLFSARKHFAASKILPFPASRVCASANCRTASVKTASRRLAPILPALRAWLSPMRKESGKVLAEVHDEFALATQFKKAVDAITNQDGEPLVKIVHNGLRHSFITYRMAVLKGRPGCAGGWEQPANDFRALS
jgi:hypothetical protein